MLESSATGQMKQSLLVDKILPAHTNKANLASLKRMARKRIEDLTKAGILRKNNHDGGNLISLINNHEDVSLKNAQNMPPTS